MQYVIILILVSVLIGLSKGGMGAVLAVLATPLLSQVMPVADAIGLALPMLMVADVFALWVYRNTWDMRYIKLVLPFAVIGIVIGTVLLANLPNQTLKHILALFTLAFAVYKLAGDRFISAEYQPRDWHGYVAGIVSGTGSALANVGGPPFTIYMLLQNLSPQTFVGTMTLFFALVNAIKLPGLMIAGLMDFSKLIGIAWVLPILPLGVWVGRYFVKRINQLAFERFMLVVLVIVAVYLLVG
ncbi:MAG: sulfite exporter TauE/SafE family protein [Anaerolinea sp.]|nr:sulfite exporter TauE/SafE family protein [Anaerolinea sp.]